ncbi:FFLEELY motif protein [Ideonella sp. BN130291]|uniref:FFLEELY motif protein n=1 Tax=Ideonella sp. BN130291 TaxID=3112940 RepID=UPI002E26D638|nr:hypothetical protein [Ideonella sp. BN130291]
MADERAGRQAMPGLQDRVMAVKAYQQARFRRGYADLLGDARYRGAATFFLEELYGPGDFSERDAQFVRIVPALVRLFPEEIVQTVEALAALHALSERLDTRMGMHLPSASLTRASYVAAWQATGEPDARSDQIRMTLDVGRALDRLTRNPVLRHSLRLMRAPARSAGLATLQAFLERGFDTFRQMRGAERFLATVAEREEALRQRLFTADAVAMATVPAVFRLEAGDPLVQLP